MEREWLLKEKGLSEQDLKRLEEGEPIDYIIGFYCFLGCKIDLSLKPLIPRSETEYWVEKIIPEIKGDCLDLFSGSGCVGLALLRHTKAKVDFADKYCLEQIKINLKINRLKGRVIFSDIFSGIDKRYDFILANPPYIPTWRRLAKSLSFEPGRSLYGGQDGLFYIRKFLEQASLYLKSSGVIYLEFDSGQKKEIERLLTNYHYQFFKDQYNRWRYLKAQKKN